MRRTRMENPLALIDPREAEAVARDVLGRMSRGTEAAVTLFHEVKARTKFANNDVQTIESETILGVNLALKNSNDQFGSGQTTLLDPKSLAALVRKTEEAANAGDKDTVGTLVLTPPQTFTDPPIYFDSSVNAGASGYQADLVRNAAMQARNAGLVAAGTIEVVTGLHLSMNAIGFLGHTRNTYGEYTMTARTKDGKGSGWAWGGGEDFHQAVDPKAIADRAIDLCQRSAKPVAVEPGRYTVILEPEAVAQLVAPIIGPETKGMDMSAADGGMTVFSKKEGGNKLGLKMADERVNILYDPTDKQLPFSPMADFGSFFSRTHWIEKGVLTNLAVQEYYGKGLKPPRKDLGNPDRAKLEIEGSTQSLEEMIKSTKRGIWVHQFAAVANTNSRTLLLTGVTRNGTFLIENGKITKAIKNLRFSESPFFILNKLDAFGPCVRASGRWAVPRLKVHDFEFTSLSDAI